jgi:hypothetical protein
MPTGNMLYAYKEKRMNEYEYSYKYMELLVKRDVSFKSVIRSFANGLDAIEFLCWERTGDFCHRYILGFLIEKIAQMDVKEITPSGEIIDLPYESIDKWLRK